MKKHSILHKLACATAAMTMILAFSCALAQPAVISGGAAVDLREQADSGAQVLGRFFSGAQVNVIGEAGEWSEVSLGTGLGTGKGYVMTKDLGASAQTDEKKAAVVVSPYGTQSVVLRDRPSNSYHPVAMLMVGDSVLVIGEMNEFKFVQTGSGCVGCLLGSELK